MVSGRKGTAHETFIADQMWR